jgi:chromosome segregation ATPase
MDILGRKSKSLLTSALAEIGRLQNSLESATRAMENERTRRISAEALTENLRSQLTVAQENIQRLEASRDEAVSERIKVLSRLAEKAVPQDDPRDLERAKAMIEANRQRAGELQQLPRVGGDPVRKAWRETDRAIMQAMLEARRRKESALMDMKSTPATQSKPN